MVRHLPAIAGLVIALSACSSEFPVAQPAAGQAASQDGGGMPGYAVRYHASELRPGDCLDPMPTSAVVTVVPCDRAHAAEYATTYILPEGAWPGADGLLRHIETGCGPRMRYVDARRDDVEASGLAPSEAEWPRNRTVYCLAVPREGGHLVGRVIK
ncbi:hypothetical protein [Nonomuraea zeae]|uniref:Septum formation-related domain-containing protein n=1 Tax=Nonomuraea zeae TaxID=1642303 RepID=A0A5S4G726_9ACTN|nr:hypothetical protein [Nonomuraea zeae]TMR28201.1 hypothetical protein ETD85_36600 [Nonomuraea zeae]